jgi:hypothetical protein
LFGGSERNEKPWLQYAISMQEFQLGNFLHTPQLRSIKLKTNGVDTKASDKIFYFLFVLTTGLFRPLADLGDNAR